MTLSNYYREMHRLASPYAERPDIVQGAGGNMSVKLDGDTMLIKASGREFGEIGDTGAGVVPVLYKKLSEYLASDEARGVGEQAHLSVVRSATPVTAGPDRPSMEVWFHTVLEPYVLHTHSVYVNILACSVEGADLFSQIMDTEGLSYLSLPYYNPGFELGEVLARELRGRTNTPSIIFLENHGIIINSRSLQTCLDLHLLVEERIKESLQMGDTVFAMRALSDTEQEDFDSLVLFPDQVIYPKHPAIRAAHRFILEHIRRSGLEVRTIADKDIDIVGNMESEKHRKNLRI